MRIIYSEHARQNMIERNISEQLVMESLNFPDKIIFSKKGRKIAHKQLVNRLLRVVYKETEKVYIIVTVYFSRSERYQNESQI